MDPLTSVAASGLRSRMESLDLLANNMANAQTSGFKVDREFYNLYVGSEATEPGAYDASQMPDIERNWTDFSQGTLRQTAGQLDFGISGDGFFAVNGPSGPLYTRNGSFQMNSKGQLVTAEGYPVRNANGKSIQLDPSQPVQLSSSGEIQQAGESVGRLQLASFTTPRELVKQGSSYFLFDGPKSAIKAGDGQIEQGKLEGSNSSESESAVRLVGIMRQFEMLQKAISIGADMNKQAVEEVARSGS